MSRSRKGCRDNSLLQRRKKRHSSEVTAHRFSTNFQKWCSRQYPIHAPCTHTQKSLEAALPKMGVKVLFPAPTLRLTAPTSQRLPPCQSHTQHTGFPSSPHAYTIQAFCCCKEKEGSQSRGNRFSPLLLGNSESERTIIKQLVQTQCTITNGQAPGRPRKCPFILACPEMGRCGQ